MIRNGKVNAKSHRVHTKYVESFEDDGTLEAGSITSSHFRVGNRIFYADESKVLVDAEDNVLYGDRYLLTSSRSIEKIRRG